MPYVGYIPQSGVSGGFWATVANRSTPVTTNTPEFDTEFYDYLIAHDLIVEADKIIAQEPNYFRFWANYDDGLGGTTTPRQLRVRDSGGVGFPHGQGGSNMQAGIMCSSIMDLAAGDYGLCDSDASMSWKANNATWLSCERLNPGLRFCRVWNDGAQVTGPSLDPVLWNQTEVNTGGFTHSTVSNTHRISVDGGSGITLVRCSAGFLNGSGIDGFLHGHMLKNGAGAAGLPQHSSNGEHNTKIISWMSAPIEVVPGTDYLQVDVYNSNASTLVSGASDPRTWFQVEEINPAYYINYRRVLVTCAAGFEISNGSFGAIEFDTEIYDTCNSWDISDPTKLYVPSGAAWARMSWGLTSDAGTDSGTSVTCINSGTSFNISGNPTGALDNELSIKHMSAVSAWVPVTPGDYFQLQAKTNNSGITTQGHTYGSLEFTN